MRVLALALAAGLALAPVPAALAFESDEAFADTVLETRARALQKSLRCLVCQNQSIDDSNAPLAKDLRRVVRERLVAGDSDREVLDYMVARYGDWVLLKPPFKAATYALWLGPALLLLAAAAGILVYFRRNRGRAIVAAPLSEAERERLEALLDDGPGA